MKPFSAYPEDRAKMLGLCAAVLKPSVYAEDSESAAIELADLVKAILEDEAVALKAPEWPSYEERCAEVERNRIEREKIQQRCECGCVTADGKCVVGDPRLCSNNP